MVSLRDKCVLIANLRFWLLRQSRVIEPKHGGLEDFKKLLPEEPFHPRPIRWFPPISPRDEFRDRPPQLVTPTHQHQRFIPLPIHAHPSMADDGYRVVKIHRF